LVGELRCGVRALPRRRSGLAATGADLRALPRIVALEAVALRRRSGGVLPRLRTPLAHRRPIRFLRRRRPLLARQRRRAQSLGSHLRSAEVAPRIDVPARLFAHRRRIRVS
jgi:hypothetical protein